MKKLILLIIYIFPILLFAEDFGKNYCLIMETQNPKNGGLVAEYKGNKYYFCCPTCLSMFNNSPEKYASKYKIITINEESKNLELSKNNDVTLKFNYKNAVTNFSIEKIKTSYKKGEKEVEFLTKKKGTFKATIETESSKYEINITIK